MLPCPVRHFRARLGTQMLLSHNATLLTPLRRSITCLLPDAELPAHTCLARPHDRLGTAAHLQLIEDAGDVIAHRLGAQEEPIRDLALAVTLAIKLRTSRSWSVKFGEIVPP